MSSERDAEFLYEVGTMRYLPRAWGQLYAWPQFANLAEHTLRVLWLALLLAERSGEAYDRGRLLTYALCHDLGEVRAGDATILTKRYVQRDEKLAMEDIVRDTSVGNLIDAMWHAYEAREDFESKLVKDADTLDCDLELVEQTERGLQVPEVLEARKNVVAPKLLTEAGRALFVEICATSSRAFLARLAEEFTQRQDESPVVPLKA